MRAKRIIPCLDMRDGKVVKGVNFVGIKEVGDPVALAMEYERQGADEIAFLDINATHEGRGTMVDVVKRTAQHITVPLTVGGGIRSVEDFQAIRDAGADKVSINSAAVRTPELIKEAAQRFGSGCVMVAIDVCRCKPGSAPTPSGYTVVINGGRVDTGFDALEWAQQVESLGAGEVLLTSMDADGTRAGYDIEVTDAVAKALGIPVIASGGCGRLEDFSRLFQESAADAALAASLFHYGELTVGQVKAHLKEQGIPVLQEDL